VLLRIRRTLLLESLKWDKRARTIDYSLGWLAKPEFALARLYHTPQETISYVLPLWFRHDTAEVVPILPPRVLCLCPCLSFTFNALTYSSTTVIFS
jgi:hypothetical protein